MAYEKKRTCSACKHWMENDAAADRGERLGIGTCLRARTFTEIAKEVRGKSGWNDSLYLDLLRVQLKEEGLVVSGDGILRTAGSESCSRWAERITAQTSSSPPSLTPLSRSL